MPVSGAGLAWLTLADAVVVTDLSDVSDEGQWMTSTGKGRLAGMAILDSEIQRALEEPMPQAVPPSDRRRDVSDHTVALTRVRRHGLSRLLLADVSGLALAAFLGPLLVSAVSSNPASAASRSGRIYLFDLAAIPMFIGRVRTVRLVPGRHPSHLDERLLRSPQHRARGDDQWVRLRHRGLCHAEERRSRRPDRREGSGHVPGGRHRRSAGPGGGLRVVQGRGRYRSSWWAPESWPRPWPATCGLIRA